ncbi:hypothetical protein Va3_010 [Vibrio phage Va3]|nr:hypothetical protein Va3_010 [Vibrio phage Va3]
MCGLFAARSKQELIELSKSNIHRGSRTHSVSTFKNGHVTVHKFTGAFNTTNVPDSADFYICHVQAPTGTSAQAHPAIVTIEENGQLHDSHVWHNGILKDHYMKNQTQEWDTAHIAEAICYGKLNELDGTFACFHFINGNLRVFRNEISPLFMSEDGTSFSSTRTILTPEHVEPNKVFNIDFKTFKMTVVNEFKTLENPYFFM